MKKYPLFLISVFMLCACVNDKTSMPSLELYAVVLNDGDHDYSRNMEEILPLSPGDFIDVTFLLDGNGTDLKSFVVKNEYENIKSTMFFYADEVSDDFTDLSEGILGYVDHVRSTFVTIKLTVREGKEEEPKIGFYLNTKSPDSEGAAYYLQLKTTTQPRMTDKE